MSDEDPHERANSQIRDAAKWLIASAAAVGAALIAGSQLSSIGALEVGWPTTVETTRLWVAVAGAVVGLVSITYILWTAVKLLPEVHVTIREIVDSWDNPSNPGLALAIAHLKQNPRYLQGFETPKALEEHRDAAVTALRAMSDEDKIKEQQDYIRGLDLRIGAVERRAASKVLLASFRTALKRLLYGTAATAMGILAFAWAANPPTTPPPTANLENAQLVDADLRDADLAGVDLDNADLTDANLTGADLTDASITDVTWRNTICPDGTNSDAAENSCAGHLTPMVNLTPEARR
jgi:hypothetical protein